MATPANTADSVFSSFPAVFDSLTIPDVIDVRPSTNLQKIIAYAGGSVDPALIAEAYREPSVDLSALNLGLILTSVSPNTGLKISSASKIQYQLRDDGGTFAGAGTHVNMTTAKGFLHADSIEAKQDDQAGAKLALKYWPLAVGSNPPLVVNKDVSVSGTPGVAALYRLGPVGYEGAVLGGVQSVSVKFGMEYKPFRAGGQVGAFEGFIRKRAPTIEIETTNMAIVAQIGMGIIAIASGLTVGFQFIGSALTAADHVLIGIPAGSYEITDAGVSGEGDAMAKITVTAAGGLLTCNPAAALA